MTCLISMPLFGYQPTLLFWVGLSLTCIATVLYACKPKRLRGVWARCTWQLGRMLSVQEPPPPAPGSTSTSMSAAMELGRGLSCAASQHAAPAVELGRSTLKAPKPTSGTRRPASNLPGASKKRGALRRSVPRHIASRSSHARTAWSQRPRPVLSTTTRITWRQSLRSDVLGSRMWPDVSCRMSPTVARTLYVAAVRRFVRSKLVVSENERDLSFLCVL